MVEDKFVVNSDQIKECIYCFFDKHVSFRRTRKSGWLGIRIMFRGLLFQGVSTITI
jgi:hypothetical protein